ncbi:MAG: Methionine adenosyltransferase [Parcubacteria group bacterium GW2011_GWA1_36_12]|nr:MAG: Methionine adenosyltransferase [Parcubacteria group bacterium GW2011_GWA1_36_12]
MKINIIHDIKSPADSDFEIVERKGRGHPDTLSDRLAELLSRTYSKFTRDKYGAILRHQFDKLSIMGGKCDVRFGGGSFKSPIRLLINGRATPRIGDEIINFQDLLINTAAKFLEKELRNFNFLTDCRVIWENTSNSTRGMIEGVNGGNSAIHHRFHPRSLKDLPESSKPISNDTAVGCSWAPFTPLEKLVLDIEQTLTSDEMWVKYPWMGSDCKIMACRIKEKVNLTVSIPQLSTHVDSVSGYKDNYNTTLALTNKIIEDSQFKNVSVTLNPGDNTDKEMLYIRLTGSCIESGDEGQVSRGNRLGGVISSCRPFSIEGLSGKNPSYHAGKIYSVAAWDIARQIFEQQKVPCEVFITSQIDRPLDDPAFIVVNSNKSIDEKKVQKIVMEKLANLREVTDKLLEGEYPLV